jgi:hypothetical protein
MRLLAKSLAHNQLSQRHQSGRADAQGEAAEAPPIREPFQRNRPVFESFLTPARIRVTLTAAALATAANVVAAQQPALSISPFMSFVRDGGTSPLAGLALTLGGSSGFAIRGSGHLALNSANGSSAFAASDARPWGADADAVLFIGGRSSNGVRSFAPFAFVGVGTSGTDAQNYESNRSNWSYGAGASIPLAGAVNLFGESRWRMSEFVLPTSQSAPATTNELRVGLTFHVGGGSR